MKNKLLKTLIFILMVVRSSVCSGSDFFLRIHNLASANGLLQSHLSNALQDRTGFMWFATWNGLVRYDGYNFYTFKPILNSDGSISSNRIYNIKLSSTGNIWCVSSDNRLYCYDMPTCMFIDVMKQLNIPKGKKVKVLTPMKKGVTWVTFKDYSCLRMVDSAYQTHFSYFPSRSSKLAGCSVVNGIEQDATGNEWVLTDKGAVCINKRHTVKGNYRFLQSVGNTTCLFASDGKMTITGDEMGKNRTFSTIREGDVKYLASSGKIIFIATDRGIYSYNMTNHVSTKLTNVSTNYLRIDSRNRVWAFTETNEVDMIAGRQVKQLFATYMPQKISMKNPQLIYETSDAHVILKPEKGRLSYYDEQTQSLKDCMFYKDNILTDYSPQEINKYIIDMEGNLWIMQTHQADCISFNQWKFNQWNNPLELESRAIFLDSHNRQWITDRSLALYLQDSTNKFMGYMSKNGEIQQNVTAFTNMPAYSITEDKAHRIWIGTKGDGLYLLTPSDGMSSRYKVEHFLHDSSDPLSLCSDSIYAIRQDKEGRIWMGSYGNGLFQAEQHIGKWYFRRLPGFPKDAKIRCIEEVKDNILMIGTSDGLITADVRDMRKPKCYNNSFRKEDWGLKGNDIMSIIKCRGKIYVCVFGSGISEITSTDELTELHFKNYLIASTATADQIKTAVCDGNCIWLVSDQSIVCFYPESGVYSIYGQEQFVDDVNFSEAAPIIYKGQVTVGTSKGLMRFFANQLNNNSGAKHIVFTGIQYQNDMTIRPLNNLKKLTISSDERSFSLYISSLDFKNMAAERYRYKLVGYDKGWTYTSENQHAVNYNNLSAGKYRLIVQVADKRGLWNASSREIDVEVVPRFVETVWFFMMIIILAISSVAGMIYAIIYFRRMHNLVQKKYSLLMTVDEFASTEFYGLEHKPIQDDDDSELFLKHAVEFFNENIGNSNLVVEDFARNQGMSRTAYYNKMKAITGLSPIDFIKQMRIKNALKLLDEGKLSIAAIAYSVGFSDQKYFSKCFRAEMNMSPTQYLKNKKTEQGTRVKD